MPFRRLCVYCGSSHGSSPVYTDAALAVADSLVDRGWELVYGGGSIGLMGVAADRMLERGGTVTGVITQDLWDREVGHTGLTANHIVDTMHQRKQLMYELSDGFLVLPGGYGTFEEFFEMLTWLQLGIHELPIGLFNVEGYFDRLLGFLDHGQAEGFIAPRNRELVLDARELDELLERMASWAQPEAAREG